MLDRYWHGPASRISPEAPVPVVSVVKEECRLGGAANVAANVAALGAQASLVGVTGDDEHGRQIGQLLRIRSIRSELVALPACPTVTKLRVIAQQQQLIRLDFETEVPMSASADLLDRFNRLLDTATAVVLSDYAKGTLSRSADMIAAAQAQRLPVVVDPKGKDFSIYRGATVVTPNYHEFVAVVGDCASEDEICRKAHTLCVQLDLQALLVTRSELGMTLVDRIGSVTQLPTLAREVFDVTGAGDTVVATLASALGCGASMIDAVHLSNAAASIVIGKLGTATVSANELDVAVLSEHRQARGGICSQDEVKRIAQRAKVDNRVVVMTNGCFDVLHAGHIEYLQSARALGDLLVVGVNDDASVSRLKGLDRPLNAIDSRMRMLSALACVDWVFSFSEDTPERIISEVLPDVLVKGGDYRLDDIAGARAVSAAGGQVKVLPYLAGHSTTGLIQKIRAQR